ncbi:MAG: MmcQ/YjbR family DNA-binding protein [Candidatus Marinimicrobia bacterium]|nr:MmcQ/YjbR family DNA-binding protein [Candidatus Neomarinimicrobiota bacterium]
MAGPIGYEELKTKLLKYKKATLDFPFDDVTACFRVINKMFALVAMDEDPLRINLKCDPNDAEALRSLYTAIIPGYYMNKKHWNTIILDGTLPVELIDDLIEDSYRLIVKSLKKSDRDQLL